MNKIIRIILPLLIASTIIFSSCKKSEDPAPASTSNQNSISGNPIIPGGTYFPTTTGNTWNYHSDNYDYTVTSTGNTEVFNNATYKELSQLLSTSTTPVMSYIYQDGNKYYSHGTSGSITLDLKLIDLDLPYGNTWATKIATNAYTDVTYTMKIVGTGMSRTVNNVNYSNVIAVQLNTSYQLSATAIALYSQYMSSSDIQQLQSSLASSNIAQITYYANNVGMIEQTSAMAGLNVQLLSSTIK